jgi:CxxC-x17-CxxC domain-containing protein
MHSATCASCGNEARVPFVPRGDKPVYCSNCYQPAARASRW